MYESTMGHMGCTWVTWVIIWVNGSYPYMGHVWVNHGSTMGHIWVIFIICVTWVIRWVNHGSCGSCMGQPRVIHGSCGSHMAPWVGYGSTMGHMLVIQNGPWLWRPLAMAAPGYGGPWLWRTGTIVTAALYECGPLR